MGKAINNLRAIPSVEKLLQATAGFDLPRPAQVAVIRRHVAELRRCGEIPAFEEIVRNIGQSLETLARSRIQPVINGTGIVVHTNLGRSPLAAAAAETLRTIATNYNNLEFDLNTGERGGRATYLEHNLALLCGAEAATVTNNCAAALVLLLRHFTRRERKEVVISREVVEGTAR